MSPGAEDVSPSPEPGNDQDTSGIMAEEKLERASTEEKSPAHGSGSESKPAAKSNAKDPNRPRRKKARRACFACQRAHLTCGMWRSVMINDLLLTASSCRRRASVSSMHQAWLAGSVP